MYKLLLLGLVFAFTAGAVGQSQTAPASQVPMGQEPVICSDGPVVAGIGSKVFAEGHPHETKVAREVRHELLMLPYYSLFDDLEYCVQGRTVTLKGNLTSIHAQTKQDAEAAVKRIEGVEKVINNIRVLPPSPFDEQIRRQAYRALVRAGPLAQYFWQAAPSIHIIVDNQRVTLTGYVNNEGDKDLAGITTNQIGNVFQVKNELRVVK